MSLLLSVLIVVGVAAIAITAMLLVRRRAPDGSYFANGDRAAGVFGVLATGFALLMGLIVFLAFSSYDESRTGAETEALIVAQQFETAQFLPADAALSLGNQLVCYARNVAYQEWPRMESGTQGSSINPWAVAMFDTLEQVDPTTAPEQAAFSKWLDQTSDRESARNDRIHGAAGVIPDPLWLVLFATAAVVFAFMLFFADSGERAVVQGVLMGTVAVVITMTLLLINFLDSPFRSGFGGLRPAAMERTMTLLNQARAVVGDSGPLPCDAEGLPAA
jgi:hypothetical protein